MSEDWTGIAAEVYGGLTEVGQSGQIVRTEKASGGTEFAPVAGTPVYHNCTVVWSKWNRRFVDGSVIRETDRKALVDASLLTVAPKVGDQLLVGGELSRIVDPIEVVGPAGVPVLYTINTRGAEIYINPDVASLDFSDADNSQYLTLLYP